MTRLSRSRFHGVNENLRAADNLHERPRSGESSDCKTMAHYFLGADGDVLFERRATRRHEVKLAITLRLDPDRSATSGFVKDISELGARVILPERIEEGRQVDFDCAEFAGSARVMWSREVDSRIHAGLSFVEITKGQAALRALLASLSAETREASGTPR